MSGFSSLLDQFKRTTEQDAVALVDGGEGSGDSVQQQQHHSSTSLRRKIEEEGYDDALTSSNRDSYKRIRTCRHDASPPTPATTPIYQRPTVPVQTIYIACPANIETGGPEALHQLCHAINNRGKETTTTMMSPPSNNSSRQLCCNNNTNNNCINSSTGKIRAFMLYLRERNYNGGTNSNTANKGKMRIEHVTSPNACPKRYSSRYYDAPPASNLPGYSSSSSSSSKEMLISSSSDGAVSALHSSEMVIWPECWTHLIDTLLPVTPVGQTTTLTNNILPYQNVIWWLSVDNNKSRFTTKDFVNRRDVLHLVQSAYAYNYVTSHLRHRKYEEENVVNNDDDGGRRREDKKTHHPDVLHLTEYIWQSSSLSNKSCPANNENFVDTTTTTIASPVVIANNTPSQQPALLVLLRDIDVVYNPAKGIHYTNEITRRAAGKTLQLVPIGKGPNGQVRMTANEVSHLLCRAKVYIDFGPHPGMDRLPREAALAGCIVITNREGAAGYDVDVPLPTEFKFGGLFNVEKIYTLLRDICVSSSRHDNYYSEEEEEEEMTWYEAYINKMKPYVEWIHGQEQRMRECVDCFINEVVTLRQCVEEK